MPRPGSVQAFVGHYTSGVAPPGPSRTVVTDGRASCHSKQGTNIGSRGLESGTSRETAERGQRSSHDNNSTEALVHRPASGQTVRQPPASRPVWVVNLKAVRGLAMIPNQHTTRAHVRHRGRRAHSPESGEKIERTRKKLVQLSRFGPWCLGRGFPSMAYVASMIPPRMSAVRVVRSRCRCQLPRPSEMWVSVGSAPWRSSAGSRPRRPRC